MKEMELFELLGDIDEKYLVELENASSKSERHKNKKIVFSPFLKKQKIIIAAACACFFVMGFAVIQNNGLASQETVTFSEKLKGTHQIVAQGLVEMEESATKDLDTSMSTSVNSTNDKMQGEVAETSQDKSGGAVQIHFPNGEIPRMVRIDGRVFADTNEYDDVARCGVMDGEITSQTKERDMIPNEDNQSNFSNNFGFQWGREENEIEILIEEHWYIFREIELES